MRGLQLVLAVGAVALLPACNLLALGSDGASGSETRNSVASNTKDDRPEEKGERRASRERTEEEPARNESRSEEPGTQTASNDQQWIVGRWGDYGCQAVLDIRSGGTIVINGSEGQWSLDGDTLTLSGGGSEQVYTVTRESGAFSLEDSNGNVQELGRC